MSAFFRIKNIDEYHAAYQASVDDPVQFWGDIADTFHWHKKMAYRTQLEF